MKGWVSVGTPGGKYNQVNFDGADQTVLKGQQPDLNNRDNILVARWAVNLRANNTDTQLGNNAALAILDGGACVRPDSAQQLRGAYWAHVEVIACKS